MPHYFFDVTHGDRKSWDKVGADCADFTEARDLAVRELALTIREELPEAERETVLITVRDTNGAPIYVAMATMFGEVLDPAL